MASGLPIADGCISTMRWALNKRINKIEKMYQILEDQSMSINILRDLTMNNLMVFISLTQFIFLAGCGPSSEQKEQWAVEACLEGNAKVNGLPRTVKESEDARRYCLDVYRGKY
jgi:hypothetical protein